MNLVFISPNFPTYYWNFCKSLRERGVTVLGIGDAPYDDLVSETRESLVEYYRVNNLQNYDEVYRAMGFFIGKYGRIDYIESQNEFWLELEAKLREDFNIHHGVRPKELEVMKYKSKMKEIYKKANVPTATYKLKNKKQVSEFLTSWDRGVSFIAEEFVNGHVETFDGITDSKANILICTSHVMMQSIMDIVNEGGDTSFYGQIVEGSDIKEVGTRVVKAFDARQKFFHFEFFRLDKDKEGLGKKGDLVGLEVNMRAPGAYIPDMMNYSYNANVYDIFADMLIYDHCFIEPKQQYCIGYAGRRNGLKYKHHSQQIRMKYKNQLISYEIVPESLSAAMANQVYLLRAKNEQEIKRMIRYVLEKDKE